MNQSDLDMCFFFFDIQEAASNTLDLGGLAADLETMVPQFLKFY